MDTSGTDHRPPLERVGALTAREREVLSMVAEGQRTATIAARLGIAENTVKSHCTNAYKKIGARNRVEATRFYLAFMAGPSQAAPISVPGPIGDLQARVRALPAGAPEAMVLRRAIDTLRDLDGL